MTMVEETSRPEDAGAPIDPMRLAIAVWQRRWVLAGAAVMGTVAGAVVAKTLVPAVFEARSVIECDRCSDPRFGDRELATLQESVKLPQHIEKARQKLSIDATLERIGRDVEVSASIESRLIHVTARGKNGELAAGLANVVVEAFIETRHQIERDKLDIHLRTLMVDAEKARTALADARTHYDHFRSENNIADLPAERQAAIQEAARLRSELAIAHGEEQAERARALALRRASSKEPSTAILQQTEDLPEAKRLGEAKAQLTAARARLSADHPRVQALVSEVKMLEQKVALAEAAITTERKVGRNPQWELAQQGILTANASQEAASSRQATYEKLVQSAAQAVARLSSIEGRASVLLSNLQNAERHAATVELDLKLAEDAARMPSTGLRILAAARAPLRPVKSTRRIVALLGPLMGALIAAICVLLGELRGLRIHTAAELAFWSKRPVLFASRWPRVPGALTDTVTELFGPLRESTGKTLVLGVSALELPHAHALVNALQEELDHRSAASCDRHSGTIEVLTRCAPAANVRQAVREADRVLVIVASGKHSAPAIQAFVTRIAPAALIGFILLDVREELAMLPDVVGDAHAFWNERRSSSARSIEQQAGQIRVKATS